MAFAKRVEQSRALETAPELLKSVPLNVRGGAMAYATAVLKERTPPQWRLTARRLLFVFEGSYIHESPPTAVEAAIR